ncbi:MAG: glutamyl-tRNA reductase [Candidatus Fischerbacteria bacterium RBG_13_37_8]|uniref:Glutamyl-tRNA reductase n=1 Tax=Candidatus Fischerbacteria bacterium RBG_13_37_8 TaxID=1817863 RepID=A0A1F5VI82_9BACT|nr:MAG: glutamyl-tRNA reductase [Candidatus Fischerbacteria bacterium RBG_13_37_8]
MLNIAVIGLNHKTAPIEIREAYNISNNDMESALSLLFEYEDIEEAFIVSTCNRFEVYVRMTDKATVLKHLQQFFSTYFRKSWEEAGRYFYFYEDIEAIKHLIRVASSMDSLVVGEPHILGQVKDAFFTAKECGGIGPIWHPLFEKVLRVVKKIKSETALSDRAISISTVAVDLARKIFGNLEEKNILVIGAGEMSELAALYMKERGAQSLYLTNRTYERAEELSNKLGGTVHPFDEFKILLPAIDIIICSISAQEYVVTYEDINKIWAQKKHNALFIMDISVPRTIDPKINTLPFAYLYDIDDLKEVAEHNRKERQKEAELAELIIEREIHTIKKWFDSLNIYPVIRALQERTEHIRVGELKTMRKKLGALPDEQQEKIDLMTKALIKKLINPLIEEIKSINLEKKEDEKIHWLRKIFKLDIKS